MPVRVTERPASMSRLTAEALRERRPIRNLAPEGTGHTEPRECERVRGRSLNPTN